MNRHMKNAIQNITVLKPRPSWNSMRDRRAVGLVVGGQHEAVFGGGR